LDSVLRLLLEFARTIFKKIHGELELWITPSCCSFCAGGLEVEWGLATGRSSSTGVLQ
jgi:hypothetical protein